jgi:nicotinic acid phosphoribosyltransferase
MIEHYKANRCDPRTKTLIFSDGLTIPRCIELFERFHGRVQVAFGVGTNLTNDVGPNALQLVLKMVRATASRWPRYRTPRQDHGGGRGLPELPAPGVRPAGAAHARQRPGHPHRAGDALILLFL